jgi:hypothetical protein
VVTVTSAAFVPSIFAAMSDTTRIAMPLLAPHVTMVCDEVVAARRVDLNSTRVGLFTFGAAINHMLQWYTGERASAFQRLVGVNAVQTSTLPMAIFVGVVSPSRKLKSLLPSLALICLEPLR